MKAPALAKIGIAFVAIIIGIGGYYIAIQLLPSIYRGSKCRTAIKRDLGYPQSSREVVELGPVQKVKGQPFVYKWSLGDKNAIANDFYCYVDQDGRARTYKLSLGFGEVEKMLTFLSMTNPELAERLKIEKERRNAARENAKNEAIAEGKAVIQRQKIKSEMVMLKAIRADEENQRIENEANRSIYNGRVNPFAPRLSASY